MKTRNLMAAFAFALCLGLGAYENFDAAYKDAQRLEKKNKNPEALAALQKAAALSQADWQRYRVFATAANIHLKTQKPEEAAKQVAALQALALNQEQTIALHLLNARVLTAQKKTADAAEQIVPSPPRFRNLFQHQIVPQFAPCRRNAVFIENASPQRWNFRFAPCDPAGLFQ